VEEGADIAIVYLDEDTDAEGDVKNVDFCKSDVERTVTSGTCL
jgi:hypothetical protein